MWPRALRVLVAAIAAMLIAVSPLGMRGIAAATTDPAAQSICRMVDDAAAANRLPAAFLARILWQESRLRNDAISPAGAEGVAQFMPRTAAEHGLADPRDPAPAIAAAARLLVNLKIQLGNLGLAAAAYNAGTGRVLKWLHRQSDLPAETHLYVVAVTGRPAEEWRSPAGALQMSGGGGEPCLAVMPDLARSALTRSASPGWALRLDRDLARAVGVVAALPTRQRDPGLEAVRASFALCDRIRLLGTRCAVYQR
jgi:Transglycosylase SLT domain